MYTDRYLGLVWGLGPHKPMGEMPADFGIRLSAKQAVSQAAFDREPDFRAGVLRDPYFVACLLVWCVRLVSLWGPPYSPTGGRIRCVLPWKWPYMPMVDTVTCLAWSCFYVLGPMSRTWMSKYAHEALGRSCPFRVDAKRLYTWFDSVWSVIQSWFDNDFSVIKT